MHSVSELMSAVLQYWTISERSMQNKKTKTSATRAKGDGRGNGRPLAKVVKLIKCLHKQEDRTTADELP